MADEEEHKRFGLTVEQAHAVKKLRAMWSCTWRAVAREMARAWPELGVLSSNQLDGEDLCLEASAILGEDIELLEDVPDDGSEWPPNRGAP